MRRQRINYASGIPSPSFQGPSVLWNIIVFRHCPRLATLEGLIRDGEEQLSNIAFATRNNTKMSTGVIKDLDSNQ
jgi:hypothetical protein